MESVFNNAKYIKTVKEFEIWEAVLNVIQMKEFLSIQRIGIVWIIYVTDNQTRVKLCETTLYIRGQSVETQSNNLYREDLREGEAADYGVMKIILKDIPLSRGNYDVEVYLDSQNIKFKRSINWKNWE